MTDPAGASPRRVCSFCGTLRNTVPVVHGNRASLCRDCHVTMAALFAAFDAPHDLSPATLAYPHDGDGRDVAT